MFERINKTLICSVVFLDIVEYSRQPVTSQMRLKEAFNALLSTALHDIAVNDRIIIDTGDGAAICFLGDPEDALFVAISLRDAVHQTPQPESPPYEVRIGINLGPAKLVKDINGRPNLLGDGINSAERIMSFAAPGYILVSRSYYEVVSCLSEEYAQLLQYHGSHTDKHVREHEVYEVGYGELARRVTQPNMPRRASPGSPSHAKRALSRRQLGLGLACIGLLAASLMLASPPEPTGSVSPALALATLPETANKIEEATAAPIPAPATPPITTPITAPAAAQLTAPTMAPRSAPGPAAISPPVSVTVPVSAPVSQAAVSAPMGATAVAPAPVIPRTTPVRTASAHPATRHTAPAQASPPDKVAAPAPKPAHTAPCPNFECWPNGRPKHDR